MKVDVTYTGQVDLEHIRREITENKTLINSIIREIGALEYNLIREIILSGLQNIEENNPEFIPPAEGVEVPIVNTDEEKEESEN